MHIGDRRRFLFAAAGICWCGLATIPPIQRPARGSDAGGEEVQFRWRVPEAHLETVRANLRYRGEEIPETDARGVPVLVIIVGATAVVYLARAILAMWKDVRYGGVYIDTRGEEVIVKTDKALDNQAIVVVSKSGTTILERDEVGDLAELVKVLKP